jgi:hypothetical protein
MAKTTTLKEFESVFPKLVEDLLDHAKHYKLPEEFVKWYKAVGLYAKSPTRFQTDGRHLVPQCQYHRRKMQSGNVRS